MFQKVFLLMVAGAVFALPGTVLADQDNGQGMCVTLDSPEFARFGPVSLSELELEASVRRVPAEHRGQFLGSVPRLADRIDQMISVRLKAYDAMSSGFLDDDVTRAILYEALLHTIVGLWEEDREAALDSAEQQQMLASLAEESYRANPERFRVATSVDFLQLLVQSEGRSDFESAQLAVSISERLAEGESFEAMVDSLSDDPAQPEGGYVNAPLERLEPALVELLGDAHPSDTVLGPVQTRHGWHFVRLIDREYGRQLTWEEAKPQAIAQARSRLIDRNEARYRERLRHGHELVMADGAVEQFVNRSDLLEDSE